MSDFQAVGQQFIAHYYSSLSAELRGQLNSLYTDASMLTYEGE